MGRRQKIAFKIESDEIDAGIRVVTFTEIYSKYLQENSPDLAGTRIEELRNAIYLRKYEVDEEVAIKAGEFKGTYNISIAEAFIGATVYIEKSAVVSDDEDFREISEIETLTESEFIYSLR
ncbi:MAG: PIN domain-containing protein [Candidatus Bathyarchaeia archaeon]